MYQKIKILHEMKFNQEILTKLLEACISLVSICYAVLSARKLTVFVKLSILSNRQRVYEFVLRSYFWKILHISLLVFLFWGFSRLYFLHMWFIVSGKGDMSHFVGVGIFWIDLNRTDLGCWRLTLKYKWNVFLLPNLKERQNQDYRFSISLLVPKL